MKISATTKTIASLTLVFGLLTAANSLYAWTSPGQNPPNGDAPGPITVGTSASSHQSIQGSLQVGSLSANGTSGVHDPGTGGYVTANPNDGSIEIGSGNDNFSYIDFKGNSQLSADYGGRIGYDTNAGTMDIFNNTWIQGNLGTHGFGPNTGLPPSWGGGVHTWDVYSEGTVGSGQSGAVRSYINAWGNMGSQVTCSTQTGRCVSTDRLVGLVAPGWRQANNTTCVSFCSSIGMVSMNDPSTGTMCLSGENRLVNTPGNIGYTYGTWGGADNGGNYNAGTSCYHWGQKQDWDGTDINVACYCG